MRKSPKVKFLVGDVRKAIKKIPDKSVQCVVTSPPYFNLRDYETDSLIWGGDPECDHEWGKERMIKNTPQRDHDGAYAFGDTRGQEDWRDGTELNASQGRCCQKCDAWLGSLGNEPTVEMYVEHIVEISKEIWRVLRDDGTFYINLGDSYDDDAGLVGMPWLVAFALKNEGWNLKSEIIEGWILEREIIWNKPNPTPESTSSRPSRSHEQIFMFTKSKKTMFWVNFKREKGTRTKPEPDYIYIDTVEGKEYEDPPEDYDSKLDRWKRKNLWKGYKHYFDMDAVRKPFKSLDTSPRKTSTIPSSTRSDRHQGQEFFGNPDGRNIRTVWEFPVARFPESHFSVFPMELPNECILESSSPKSCEHCGASWVRKVEREVQHRSHAARGGNFDLQGKYGDVTPRDDIRDDNDVRLGPVTITKTAGWIPSCDCSDNNGSGRSVILDPFGGSGTTGISAHNNGRDCILIDLKKEYAEMAARRLKKEGDYKTELGEFE